MIHTSSDAEAFSAPWIAGRAKFMELTLATTWTNERVRMQRMSHRFGWPASPAEMGDETWEDMGSAFQPLPGKGSQGSIGDRSWVTWL